MTDLAAVSTAGAVRRHLPLYVGGFLGPFGTMVIIPMFPELRDSFDASSQAVGWGFTAYMFPFALLLLVSGTLGERWGRRRTVRATYLVYAAASVGCALAPDLGWFIVFRAVQGTANAFVTPLLLAGLAETVPPERFGRLVGIYASFQALGGAAAPALGGVAADTTWRAAFIGTAVLSAALALAPPPGDPRADVDPPPVRPLLTRPMTELGIAAFAAAAGPLGLAVLVGVLARDELHISGTAAGFVVMIGSLSAMVVGPAWGRVVDRVGTRVAGIGSSVVLTVLAAAVGFAGGAWVLGVLWLAAGAFVGLLTIVLQATATTAVPDNRGGALSYILAFRFLGHGVGPLVWLAVFERSVEGSFVGAAALGLVVAAVFARR